MKSSLKSPLGELFEDAFKEIYYEDYPGLNELLYQQQFNFDSGGNNYGLEIRFYPLGKESVISFGLAIEKTKMEVKLDGSVQTQFIDGSFFKGTTDGKLIVAPVSYHFNLRWEIKPSWRVHPYLTLGLGIARLKGTVSYFYSGEFYNALDGTLESQSNSDELTLDELEEENEDLDLPNDLPIIQFNLGVKGRIVEDLSLLIDFGLWNGFLFRFGLAYRF
ncbi:MAG: hypothetical protein ACE5WD_01010 [Candidatus Aminicenantia bacterium]